MSTELIGTVQFAAELNVSSQAVLKWIRKGPLKAVRNTFNPKIEWLLMKFRVEFDQDLAPISRTGYKPAN